MWLEKFIFIKPHAQSHKCEDRIKSRSWYQAWSEYDEEKREITHAYINFEIHVFIRNLFINQLLLKDAL